MIQTILTHEYPMYPMGIMGSEAPSRQRYDGRHLCCGLAVASPGSARGGGGRGLRPAHSGSAADTRMEGLVQTIRMVR